MQFIEPGSTFKDIVGLKQGTTPQTSPREPERYDVIVIGAGQAGLVAGYYLKKRGLRFLILDANERVGDAWRQRWDSLRLFTPAKFDAIDGMPFPAHPDAFPTKDEMADYLESYAKHFELPVRNGVRVQNLTREGDRYRILAGEHEFEAEQVVVAMSHFQKSRFPSFAQELASDITQLHSVEYKNPSQLKEGAVLLIGAGNSGSEIAMELAARHRVYMAGRDVGQVPFRIGGFWGKLILARLVLRVVFHRLMTLKTPIGRKMRTKMLTQGGPLIRVKNADLLAKGVERVPRVAGVEDGLPVLTDGRRLDVKNVIFCTGYNHGQSWIKLPVFAPDGEPRHTSGIATDAPGLYFVGLMFLHAASSTMIHGVSRDAKRIVENIVAERTSWATVEAKPRLLAAAG
jgi:putative flavoprotein involved in K+ transport